MYEVTYFNKFSKLEHTKIVDEAEFLILIDEIINSAFLTLLTVRKI